jgi:hypothetical protein
MQPTSLIVFFFKNNKKSYSKDIPMILSLYAIKKNQKEYAHK